MWKFLLLIFVHINYSKCSFAIVGSRTINKGEDLQLFVTSTNDKGFKDLEIVVDSYIDGEIDGTKKIINIDGFNSTVVNIEVRKVFLKVN
jgi:hypothetical protein